MVGLAPKCARWRAATRPSPPLLPGPVHGDAENEDDVLSGLGLRSGSGFGGERVQREGLGEKG